MAYVYYLSNSETYIVCNLGCYLHEVSMNNTLQTFRKDVLNSVNEIQATLISGKQKPLLETERASIESVSSFKNQFSSYTQRLNSEITNYNSLLDQLIINDGEYKKGVALMDSENINSFKRAIEIFLSLGDYKNSKDLLQQCRDKLHALAEAKKEQIKAEAIETKYQYALSLMKEGRYLEAADIFEKLGDYKDSPTLKTECLKLAKKLSKGDSTSSKKKIIAISIVSIIVIIGICLVVGGVISNTNSQPSTLPYSTHPINEVATVVPTQTNQNTISIIDLSNPSKSTSVDISNKNKATIYSNTIRFRDLAGDTFLPSGVENMDKYSIRIENPIPVITITVDYDYEMMTYTQTYRDEDTNQKRTVTKTVPETSQYAEILVYDSSGRIIKQDGFSGGLYGGYSASKSQSQIKILTRDSYYNVVLRGDGMGVKVTVTYG